MSKYNPFTYTTIRIFFVLICDVIYLHLRCLLLLCCVNFRRCSESVLVFPKSTAAHCTVGLTGFVLESVVQMSGKSCIPGSRRRRGDESPGRSPRSHYIRRHTSAKSSTALQEPSQVLSPSFLLLPNITSITLNKQPKPLSCLLFAFLCV